MSIVTSSRAQPASGHLRTCREGAPYKGKRGEAPARSPIRSLAPISICTRLSTRPWTLRPHIVRPTPSPQSPIPWQHPTPGRGETFDFRSHDELRTALRRYGLKASCRRWGPSPRRDRTGRNVGRYRAGAAPQSSPAEAYRKGRAGFIPKVTRLVGRIRYLLRTRGWLATKRQMQKLRSEHIFASVPHGSDNCRGACCRRPQTSEPERSTSVLSGKATNAFCDRSTTKQGARICPQPREERTRP